MIPKLPIPWPIIPGPENPNIFQILNSALTIFVVNMLIIFYILLLAATVVFWTWQILERILFRNDPYYLYLKEMKKHDYQ